MSLIKKVTPILIIIAIIALVWVGFSIYFQASGVEINSEASNFTKPISPSFDKEVLEEVNTRTEESFPVSPQEFLNLNSSD